MNVQRSLKVLSLYLLFLKLDTDVSRHSFLAGIMDNPSCPYQLAMAFRFRQEIASLLFKQGIPAEIQVGRTQGSIFEAVLVGKRVETSHLPVNDGGQLVALLSRRCCRHSLPHENIARL